MSHNSSYFTAFRCRAKIFQNRELHDAETFLKVSEAFRLSEISCKIPSCFYFYGGSQVKTKGCVRFVLLKQVLSLC